MTDPEQEITRLLKRVQDETSDLGGEDLTRAPMYLGLHGYSEEWMNALFAVMEDSGAFLFQKALAATGDTLKSKVVVGRWQMAMSLLIGTLATEERVVGRPR